MCESPKNFWQENDSAVVDSTCKRPRLMEQPGSFALRDLSKSQRAFSFACARERSGLSG